MKRLILLFIAILSAAVQQLAFAESDNSGWGARTVDGVAAVDYAYHWKSLNKTDNPAIKATLAFDSEGTIVSKSKVSNGTVTKIGGDLFKPLPLLASWVNGLDFSLSGKLETVQLDDKLAAGMALKSAGGSLNLHTSLLNGPFQKAMDVVISSDMASIRSLQGLQLDVGCSYAGERGEDKASTRGDVNLLLELPFHPKFIVKGNWKYSREFSTGRDYRYKQIQVGQKLSGTDDKSDRYIYIQWGKGAKAPDFKETEETSIGYSTFF